MRLACAYNLPAMLLFVGPAHFTDQLFATFCDLATDPSPGVRKTLASSLHELIKIIGKINMKEIKNHEEGFTVCKRKGKGRRCCLRDRIYSNLDCAGCYPLGRPAMNPSNSVPYTAATSFALSSV